MARRNDSTIKAVALVFFVVLVVFFLYSYQDLHARLRKSDERGDRLTQQHDSLAAQLQVLTELKSRLENSLKSGNDQHEREKQDLFAERDNLEQRFRQEKKDLLGRIDSLTQQNNMHQSQTELLQDQLGKMENDLKQLQNDKTAADDQRLLEFKQLEQEKDNIIASYKDEVANLQRQNRKLQIDIDAAREQINKMNQDGEKQQIVQQHEQQQVHQNIQPQMDANNMQINKPGDDKHPGYHKVDTIQPDAKRSIQEDLARAQATGDAERRAAGVGGDEGVYQQQVKPPQQPDHLQDGDMAQRMIGDDVAAQQGIGDHGPPHVLQDEQHGPESLNIGRRFGNRDNSLNMDDKGLAQDNKQNRENELSDVDMMAGLKKRSPNHISNKDDGVIGRSERNQEDRRHAHVVAGREVGAGRDVFMGDGAGDGEGVGVADVYDEGDKGNDDEDDNEQDDERDGNEDDDDGDDDYPLLDRNNHRDVDADQEHDDEPVYHDDVNANLEAPVPDGNDGGDGAPVDLPLAAPQDQPQLPLPDHNPDAPDSNDGAMFDNQWPDNNAINPRRTR